LGVKKRTFLEKLIAQWPGLVGLGSVGLGVLIIWQIHKDGANSGDRSGIIFIIFGVALLAYWAFSSNNDDYNF
jgi:hypothetical protein